VKKTVPSQETYSLEGETIKEACQNYTQAPNHQGEVKRELQLRECAEGNKS